MVAVSLLPHAEFGPNGHREDASHYIIVNSATKTKNNTLCTRLGTRLGTTTGDTPDTTLSTTLDATIYTTLSPYINDRRKPSRVVPSLVSCMVGEIQ